MSNYKKFIKNIPEEFGKLFDVIYNQLNQLEPEKITTIMNPDTMPADFVPFVAWQLGVLYETVMNGLDPAKMYELKQLRKLEGTAAGVKAALALIPDSSFEYENTGPCLFQLKFKPEIDSVFSQKSWDYLYSLINDYKRKSAHCTLYLEREKHVDLKLASAVRNDRVIEFPLQAIPKLAITSPASGSEFEVATTITLAYNYIGINTINIYYKKNGGAETVYDLGAEATGIYYFNTTMGLADGDTLEIIIKDADNLVVQTSITLKAIVSTLSLTTYPETIAPDTDMEIGGTSTHLAGETVTIQTKKSTAGDETYASIGTAVVQEDGTWTKANAQLPSATFAAGDTANIRAVSGTVQSEVVGVGVSAAGYVKILSILDDGIFVEIQSKKTII